MMQPPSGGTDREPSPPTLKERLARSLTLRGRSPATRDSTRPSQPSELPALPNFEAIQGRGHSTSQKQRKSPTSTACNIKGHSWRTKQHVRAVKQSVELGAELKADESFRVQISPTGAVVMDVIEPDSPADQATLEQDDVVVEVNGYKSPDQLLAEIHRCVQKKEKMRVQVMPKRDWENTVVQMMVREIKQRDVEAEAELTAAEYALQDALDSNDLDCIALAEQQLSEARESATEASYEQSDFLSSPRNARVSKAVAAFYGVSKAVSRAVAGAEAEVVPASHKSQSAAIRVAQSMLITSKIGGTKAAVKQEDAQEALLDAQRALMVANAAGDSSAVSVAKQAVAVAGAELKQVRIASEGFQHAEASLDSAQEVVVSAEGQAQQEDAEAANSLESSQQEVLTACESWLDERCIAHHTLSADTPEGAASVAAAGGCGCVFKDVATLQLEAKELYAAADLHGNGVLSKTEMKKVIQKDDAVRARLLVAGWKGFFAELDGDGDGRIEREELVAFYVLKLSICQHGATAPVETPNAGDTPIAGETQDFPEAILSTAAVEQAAEAKAGTVADVNASLPPATEDATREPATEDERRDQAKQAIKAKMQARREAREKARLASREQLRANTALELPPAVASHDDSSQVIDLAEGSHYQKPDSNSEPDSSCQPEAPAAADVGEADGVIAPSESQSARAAMVAAQCVLTSSKTSATEKAVTQEDVQETRAVADLDEVSKTVSRVVAGAEAEAGCPDVCQGSEAQSAHVAIRVAQSMLITSKIGGTKAAVKQEDAQEALLDAQRALMVANTAGDSSAVSVAKQAGAELKQVRIASEGFQHAEVSLDSEGESRDRAWSTIAHADGESCLLQLEASAEGHAQEGGAIALTVGNTTSVELPATSTEARGGMLQVANSMMLLSAIQRATATAAVKQEDAQEALLDAQRALMVANAAGDSSAVSVAKQAVAVAGAELKQVRIASEGFQHAEASLDSAQAVMASVTQPEEDMTDEEWLAATPMSTRQRAATAPSLFCVGEKRGKQALKGVQQVVASVRSAAGGSSSLKTRIKPCQQPPVEMTERFSLDLPKKTLKLQPTQAEKEAAARAKAEEEERARAEEAARAEAARAEAAEEAVRVRAEQEITRLEAEEEAARVEEEKMAKAEEAELLILEAEEAARAARARAEDEEAAEVERLMAEAAKAARAAQARAQEEELEEAARLILWEEQAAKLAIVKAEAEEEAEAVRARAEAAEAVRLRAEAEARAEEAAQKAVRVRAEEAKATRARQRADTVKATAEAEEAVSARLEAAGSSIPRNTGSSTARGTGSSTPRGTGSSIPRNTGSSTARGTGSSIPRGTSSSTARGTGSSIPRGIGSSTPRGTGSSIPRGIGSSIPRGIGSSTPRGTGSSTPRGTGSSTPIKGKDSAVPTRRQQLQNIFVEMDLDESGFIESSELSQLAQMRRSIHHNEDDKAWTDSMNLRLLQHIDSSGDGRIDMSEFVDHYDRLFEARGEDEFNSWVEQFGKVAQELNKRKAATLERVTRGTGSSIPRGSSTPRGQLKKQAASASTPRSIRDTLLAPGLSHSDPDSNTAESVDQMAAREPLSAHEPMAESVEQMAARVMLVADQHNTNQLLTVTELRTFVAHEPFTQWLTGGRGAGRGKMTKYDTNKDGAIDLNELTQACADYLAESGHNAAEESTPKCPKADTSAPRTKGPSQQAMSDIDAMLPQRGSVASSTPRGTGSNTPRGTGSSIPRGMNNGSSTARNTSEQNAINESQTPQPLMPTLNFAQLRARQRDEAVKATAEAEEALSARFEAARVRAEVEEAAAKAKRNKVQSLPALGTGSSTPRGTGSNTPRGTGSSIPRGMNNGSSTPRGTGSSTARNTVRLNPIAESQSLQCVMPSLNFAHLNRHTTHLSASTPRADSCAPTDLSGLVTPRVDLMTPRTYVGTCSPRSDMMITPRSDMLSPRSELLLSQQRCVTITQLREFYNGLRVGM